MGARGPVKLADKRAEMKRQKRANKAGERQATPRMPGWLSNEAKKEWRRVARPLFERGLFTEMDVPALGMYCETWATYVRNQRVLAEQGDTFIKANGDPKQRPEYYIARDAQQELRALIQLFGLSPTARMRMDLPTENGGDDAMAAILD